MYSFWECCIYSVNRAPQKFARGTLRGKKKKGAVTVSHDGWGNANYLQKVWVFLWNCNSKSLRPCWAASARWAERKQARWWASFAFLYQIAMSKLQGAVKHHMPWSTRAIQTELSYLSWSLSDSVTVCFPMFSSHGNKGLGRENGITHTWAPSQHRNKVHNNPGTGVSYYVEADEPHNPYPRS